MDQTQSRASELETVHLALDNAIWLVRRMEGLVGGLVGRSTGGETPASPAPPSGILPALGRRASYVSGEILNANVLLDQLMDMTAVGTNPSPSDQSTTKAVNYLNSDFGRATK